MPDQLTIEPAAIAEITEWAAWFAWRPVRLYMNGKIVWLRWVFRRCVTHASGFSTCDYTIEPEQFPRGTPSESKALSQRPLFFG